MYYIILEITLGRDWSHTSYSTEISQVKMIKRKLKEITGLEDVEYAVFMRGKY